MNIQVTNGVSFGAIIKVADMEDDTITVKFVGVSGEPVDYDLAVVCVGATYEKEGDEYTFTPEDTAEEIHIVAQRAYVIGA